MAYATAVQATLLYTQNILHLAQHQQAIVTATMHFVSAQNQAKVQQNTAPMIQSCSAFIFISMTVIFQAALRQTQIIWHHRTFKAATFIREILPGKFTSGLR